MDASALEELRYPIGKFQIPDRMGDRVLDQWIGQLENFPKTLSRLVSGLSREQLDTPYRPEGWTIRQVVHHLADSHHNAYIRYKWALTEEHPEIKTYDQAAWAQLPDSDLAPIAHSLDHLAAVHARLVYLLKRLDNDQWDRSFFHPEKQKSLTLRENTGHYVWHGNHHYTQVRNLLLRKAWL